MSQTGGGNCRFCIDPKCKGTCTKEEAKLRTAVLADLIVEARVVKNTYPGIQDPDTQESGYAII